MLLKKMNLENFRQFIGTQSIDFSTDPDRNVTIILGENGSGKTTLAQAFTWCLYGDTDFDDKNVLNKKVAQKIGPNGEASVKVELNLKHMEIEYTIIREQKYTTDATGNLKRPNNSVFKIAYRNSDGQQEFIRENETEVRMKQILPKELSKYFFFDGERIGNMSKEIKKGKSPEFAEAVKSLLGLSAFTAALDHLNGRSSSSVIKSYDEDYDSKSDSKIARYREEMKKYEDRLAVIEKRLEEIDNEELTAKEKQKEYEIKLIENKDSEKLANERTHLIDKIKRLEENKIRNTYSILENFNKSGAFWMSSKLINDALEELANADKLDTGIPDIHARTIQYLLGRKKCICGADIEFGSSAYTELNRLLDYIPPKSIGTIIAQFTRECELKCKSTDGMFEQISSVYSALRELENDHDQAIQDIEIIDHKLEGMLDVGELQKRYSFYTKQLSILRDERNRLLVEQGGLSTSRDRCDTEINKLVLKDDNNRRIAQCKAYAIYMYRCLSAVYKEKETETRERLEKVVNDIFKKIYNGGFSLKIDEKYNDIVNIG